MTFTSCLNSNYIVENKFQTIGLDFSKGKWLLNEIDCPNKVYKTLGYAVNKDFKRILGSRFYKTGDVNTIILPKKININPDKNSLSAISKGCIGYDYMINIKASIIKSELGTIEISAHNFKEDKTNKSEVIMEVYDINSSQIIYSQRVSGTSSIYKSNKTDVEFSKSAETLVVRSYKKLMKKLMKKSIN